MLSDNLTVTAHVECHYLTPHHPPPLLLWQQWEQTPKANCSEHVPALQLHENSTELPSPPEDGTKQQKQRTEHKFNSTDYSDNFSRHKRSNEHAAMLPHSPKRAPGMHTRQIYTSSTTTITSNNRDLWI